MTRPVPAPERVQKLLATEGVGSRRSIEELIRRRQVRINERIAQLGDRASAADKIYIDGRYIPIRGRPALQVLVYHKPNGELVTRSSSCGHQTVFERLPKPGHGRWVAVGRLDLNTSGVLLLCNDGELAQRLMHPSYRVPRVYRVRVKGKVSEAALRNLLTGVSLGGRTARFESIERKGTAGGCNHWFEVTLREGRNREVRRLWQSQHLEVSRLIRISFAGIALDMLPGTWHELDPVASLDLCRQVGLEPDCWK